MISPNKITILKNLCQPVTGTILTIISSTTAAKADSKIRLDVAPHLQAQRPDVRLFYQKARLPPRILPTIQLSDAGLIGGLSSIHSLARHTRIISNHSTGPQRHSPANVAARVQPPHQNRAVLPTRRKLFRKVGMNQPDHFRCRPAPGDELF